MNKAKITFLLAMMGLFSLVLPAQVSQCSIEYQVDIVGAKGVPPQAQEMMKDMVMTLAFNENASRMDMDMAMVQVSAISDGQEERTVVLNSMMGQKTAQVIEGDDFEEAQAQSGSPEDYEVRETGETKTIAGYLCRQAFISGPQIEEEVELWYTKKIVPATNLTQYDYQGIDGFPLEMVVNQQGMKMRMTASRVDTDPKPDGYFDAVVPEGYTIQNR